MVQSTGDIDYSWADRWCPESLLLTCPIQSLGCELKTNCKYAFEVNSFPQPLQPCMSYDDPSLPFLSS